MPVLWDNKEERFAQLIVEGKSPSEAAEEVGRTAGVGSMWVRRQHIAARIRELTERAAQHAQLSREDILENVTRQMKLAEKLGQCAAALKASEMLGKELHRMFVERKELGAPGEFDLNNKTEQELKDFIAQQLKDMNLDLNPIPQIADQSESPDDESVKLTIASSMVN